MAEDFLRRWSRRKHEHATEAEKPKPVEKSEPAKPAAPLPAVEKLTSDADFTGFMQPKVEDALRRAALKKLFVDPHFNIPDPFEPYSGDWTGEALTPDMLAKLEQAKQLLFDKKDEPKPEQEALEEKKDGEEKKPDEPGRQDA